MCLPPKEYSADVKGEGGEARASEGRTDVLCCSGGPPLGLIGLRQVAAHVKPLRADSNDTGQELLARVTQRCACVCVQACVCASASV